ncbi:hypothetical protein ALO94_201217 [Pseudomonas syringae pv. spinaceae]|uniref:Competence protein ComF n=1 Tax=Pseudomonas syringae pv. spinaceae TaxID=264459 RepID=A0A0Q0DUF5_PSESX|nr:hypothetical protein ALO94_201217 [Pseudomonas syringae pv. spinaceae]
MLLWIKFFKPGAKHADCKPTDIQCALMRSTVDAPRQTAGDHKTGTGQAACKCLGGVQPGLGGATATDHSQLRALKNGRVAGDENQRRRIGDLRQQRGVARVVPHQ